MTKTEQTPHQDTPDDGVKKPQRVSKGGVSKNKQHDLPIDRGWAWMVLLGVTMWNFILGGTVKSYGVIYMEMIELFDSTPTEASLVGLSFGIVAMLLSPISGRLSDSYSARKMSLVGGLIACAGVAGTGYAPNIWVSVLTYGFLFGMIEVPSRICLSWMSDRFQLASSSVLTISFFVTGVCGQAFILAPSHSTMIAYAIVHGVLGGLSMVLMSSVLAACVGARHLGSAMGLALMLMHLAVSLSSTTAGAMKQLTGSYGNVFRVSSAIYLLAAVAYCVTPRGFFANPYKSCKKYKSVSANGV